MIDIKQRRDGFDQLGKLYPKEASVKVEQDSVNGVNTYWFTPEKPAEKKIIIHLHGGVYAVGSIRSHESFVSHLANKLKTTILFVDYALAPEHPYPAANNDVFAVYTQLLNDYPDHQIGFIGDSAGSGLIIYAIGEMLKQELPLPYAVAMISPWIDLAGINPSYQRNKATDPVLSTEYIQSAAKDYLGSADIKKANPENVILSAFPPVLIVVGSTEVLLDDSKNFYSSVKELHSDATLTIYDKQNHVWPLSNISSEASQKLLQELKEFFNS